MTRRFIRKIFPLLAILLLAPWPVAYAYDNEAATQGTVQIQVAEPRAAPSWSVFGRAIGGVTTPGDLFYIDTTNNSADILVTLYLTNSQELIHCYRYITLKVGVYIQTNATEWEKAADGNGELIPDTYIALHNGQVSFTLPGCAKYKVAIDSGCFYCVNANTDKGSVSPTFYLTVN